MFEGERLEFKREWSESAKKTVVAFANSGGGKILIGVADDGSVLGLANPDATLVQAINAATDGIRPDIGLFLGASVEEADGKQIVQLEVQRGTDRPYYLSEKGLRPAGVYVRKGASSVPASDAEIRFMIKDAAGDSFENARSVDQALTFADAQEAFKEAGVEWGESQMRTLGVVSDDGMFTNLGWLLSDQCGATTKTAVFNGVSKLEFRTRREFSGSLFKQFHEIAEFIDLYNGMHSTIGADFRRTDVRDYPRAAVREALLNSIVHRDYSYSGPGLISMFDNRMEIVNFGGLPKGLTKNDMMLGVSLQRNPRLAQVFYRLHLIEAYGTGVPKIMESYDGCKRMPEFAVSDNVFKVTLPSFNAFREEEVEVSPDEKSALELAGCERGVTRAMLQQRLGISQSSAINLLRRLTTRGLLKATGGGRSTRYVLP